MIGIGIGETEGDNVVCLDRYWLAYGAKPQVRQLQADGGQVIVGRFPHHLRQPFLMEGPDLFTDHRADGGQIIGVHARHAALAWAGVSFAAEARRLAGSGQAPIGIPSSRSNRCARASDGVLPPAITTAITPKRDVDLFGETTVMVQAKRDPASSGVPVLYVSTYVSDPMVFAQRCAAALAWLDGDATVSPPARAGVVPNKPTPEAAAPATTAYTLPDYVEDVDYSERLALADPMTLEAWKGWAGAMTRRVELAQDSLQLAALIAANDYGMKFCPPQLLTTVRKALSDAYTVTYNQAAAA